MVTELLLDTVGLISNKSVVQGRLAGMQGTLFELQVQERSQFCNAHTTLGTSLSRVCVGRCEEKSGQPPKPLKKVNFLSWDFQR